MAFLEEEKREITQDNCLVRAAYSMPLNSKRLLSLMMSKVNPVAIPTGKPLEVTITADEWAKYFGELNAYRAFKRAVEDLATRSLELPPESKADETQANWLDARSYFHNQGKAKVRFSYTVTLLITDLYEQFTKYSLFDVIGIKSTHTFRLYELLKQFSSTGVYHTSIKDMRRILNLNDKYPRYTDLKKFVIKKSVSEINRETDLLVEVEEFKKGRSVESIRFYFREKKQQDLLNTSPSLKLKS